MRHDLRVVRREQSSILNDKLLRLSTEQERSLFNVNNTIICYNLDKNPPKYVTDTLSLGPRNPVLGKFDENDILAELDDLLKYCKDNNVN